MYVLIKVSKGDHFMGDIVSIALFHGYDFWLSVLSQLNLRNCTKTLSIGIS